MMSDYLLILAGILAIVLIGIAIAEDMDEDDDDGN